MIPPPFSEMSKLIIRGFAASREIVSQEEPVGCPWYAGLRVVGRHMGATSATPWLPPSYGSPSVSSRYQDLRQGWLGFKLSVKFEVWLPRHTNRREGEKPYRASQLPPAMQRHPGHYGGILHNEPREIQISRISVWAVMLSGEIPMAWLSSGPWSSIPSTHAINRTF